MSRWKILCYVLCHAPVGVITNLIESDEVVDEGTQAWLVDAIKRCEDNVGLVQDVLCCVMRHDALRVAGTSVVCKVQASRRRTESSSV